MVKVKNITERVQSICCLGIGAFQPGETRELTEKEASRIIGRNDAFIAIEELGSKESFKAIDNTVCEGECEVEEVKKKKKK